MSRLREALSQAINSTSTENWSNTPDFVLAEFLCGCLTAFDAGVNRRAEWYGRHDSIGGSGADPRVPAVPIALAEPTEPARRYSMEDIEAAYISATVASPFDGPWLAEFRAALEKAD